MDAFGELIRVDTTHLERVLSGHEMVFNIRRTAHTNQLLALHMIQVVD